MTPSSPAALDELVRASSLLSDEISFSRMVSVLVEQSLDITRSDTAALYLYSEPDGGGDLELAYRRGRAEVVRTIPRSSELIAFLEECGESVVLLSRRKSPFEQVFLVATARSGIALPIASSRSRIGVLILNANDERHYNRERLSFLDSLAGLAAGMLTNARLYRELQEYLRKIEELERYQQSIFESMTNLLVTIDADARIHYFNRAAAERLSLEESHLGRSFREVFSKGFSKKVMNTIERVTEDGESILGIEGIYKRREHEMDFGLNISPLRRKRGRHEGLTLLFTDQTAEKDLRAQMRVVTEERRIIKDMFASYLSEDIVKMLVEHPELVKPGGGSREATIFFADIAGYTSFSEGREPEYIVTMLNEFFEEAEPLVRKYHGYLDKYIGDCIMAVFGVPLDTGTEDTVSAVKCAIELQDLVNHPGRPFFTGEAEHLRIQIGMHSGPVVAGNIGGSRRMDFTEIGDTVNVAARLEGVARPGEIIISSQTREQIGDQFRLEERKPTRVKGKAKPIRIYNVLGIAEA
ncbi:MAG: adenylate/guanylate cyclase domain-containing protein [Spirochaetota bacterium]